MKVILLFAFLGSIAMAAGPQPSKAPSIVGNEYEKTHTYFVKTFQQNKQSIEDLKKEKEDTIARAKEDAIFFAEGVEALNKYDVLLILRNTDDKGEYDKRKEIAAEDVKNLNAIFQKYLRATLLDDRASAGYARKMISRGVHQLEELVSDSKDPDESNNPVLEIISKRLEDATQKTTLIVDFAKRIGIDVQRELASEPPAPEPVQKTPSHPEKGPKK